MTTAEQRTVRYQVLQPEEYDPYPEHVHLGDGVYLAEDTSGLDMLEETDVIEVLDWDYSGDRHGPNPDAPPEPLLDTDEDGEQSVRIVHAVEQDGGAEFDTVEVGAWECQRCDVITRTPTGDGLREPPECRNCERQGPFIHAGPLTAEDAEAAARAPDIWEPPETVDDTGYADLWDDVRQYIRGHWDASEPEVYEGLTAYALTTWVRENLTFVPHLMLMGKTTGGKTRLLNTLARVSYRGVVTASATPASMFRLIDAYDVSYYISEYHGLDHDAQRELDNVVRAGQKRGEVVTRAEPSSEGFEPTVFDPFAHVAIATQYTPADDIVNRCIQVRSSPANRDMPATLDEEDAQGLRNRLLYARFRLLGSDEWDEAEQRAYDYLRDHEITGRTREKLLSLLTVAHLWGRLEEFGPFVEAVVEQDQEAAADSEDALVVEAIRDLAFDEIAETSVLGDADPFSAVEIPYSVDEEDPSEGIAERFEAMTGTEKSASWVGHVVSRLGFEKKRTRDGTVIADPDLREKLQELCEDHNLAWERRESRHDVEELPADDKGRGAGGCPLCGHDRTLTHRHPPGNGQRICEECAEEVAEA